MDGFDVIGYAENATPVYIQVAICLIRLARKSPTKISGDELKKIIENMISYLQSRSKVIDVYVSPNIYSKNPIAARDMTMDEDYTDISGCVGNTQCKF